MSRVFVKNKLNGVIYIYESVGYWDKQKKQARNKRKCIGKLDPATGEIIPSHKIDLADLMSSVKKRGPKPVLASKRLFYGATYLFDAIGEKLGVTRDLQTCFPGFLPNWPSWLETPCNHHKNIWLRICSF